MPASATWRVWSTPRWTLHLLSRKVAFHYSSCLNDFKYAWNHSEILAGFFFTDPQAAWTTFERQHRTSLIMLLLENRKNMTFHALGKKIALIAVIRVNVSHANIFSPPRCHPKVSSPWSETESPPTSTPEQRDCDIRHRKGKFLFYGYTVTEKKILIKRYEKSTMPVPVCARVRSSLRRCRPMRFTYAARSWARYWTASLTEGYVLPCKAWAGFSPLVKFTPIGSQVVPSIDKKISNNKPLEMWSCSCPLSKHVGPLLFTLSGINCFSAALNIWDWVTETWNNWAELTIRPHFCSLAGRANNRVFQKEVWGYANCWREQRTPRLVDPPIFS